LPALATPVAWREPLFSFRGSPAVSPMNDVRRLASDRTRAA